MKKTLPLLLLILITASIGANEHWLYAGFEYSKIFESVGSGNSSSKRNVSSMGANISGYTFNNQSPGGLFFHTAILYPTAMTVTNDDEVIKLTQDDVVYSYIFSIMAGPAFRTPSIGNFQAYGGIGLHGSAFLVGMGSAYYEEYVAQKNYNVGLGLEAAGKLDITDNFYFTLGITAVWDFYNVTEMRINGYEAEDQFNDFRTFVVNPFICTGFSWKS